MECDGDNADNNSSDVNDAFGALGAFEKHFGKHKSVGRSSIHPDSDNYDMRHKNRGLCLIFNHKNFEKHTNLNIRNGTDVDAERLYHRFRELDFTVAVHVDLSCSQVLEKITEAGKRDCSDDDCFVCCILSHGEEGIVYGRDGKIALEMFLAPFRGDVCPTLAGKPKLFFIQACQGDKLDKGVEMRHREKVEHDSVHKIPTHADFLIAYSTVPGFYSWRNTSNGSWFIQGLVAVLEKEGTENDLLGIMTKVNRFVSYGFESCVPRDSYMDRKKQVPFITTTLTRKVLFVPKF